MPNFQVCASRVRFLPLVCLLCLPAPVAWAVSFGTIDDWQNQPDQTISLDDKSFVYLSDSGNWDGQENINLGIFPPNTHTFGMDALESLIGPSTFWIAYRVNISSVNVFQSVAVDQTVLQAGVTTTKDIFDSLATLNANPGPGTGNVATLSITDFTPTPPPPVPLPGVQTLWVRDTVSLVAGAGVQSIANSYVQVVPEPDVRLLAGAGVGLAMLAIRRRSRACHGPGRE